MMADFTSFLLLLKQDPTRDTIFDVFDIVNVQCSMFNVIVVFSSLKYIFGRLYCQNGQKDPKDSQKKYIHII